MHVHECCGPSDHTQRSKVAQPYDLAVSVGQECGLSWVFRFSPRQAVVKATPGPGAHLKVALGRALLPGSPAYRQNFVP